MRRVLLIALGGILILSLSLMFFATRSTKMRLGSPFATSINFPKLIEDGHLYYFSGSAFVDYQLDKSTTSGLTPFYRLPDITNIKWSQNGALFSAINYSPADELYPQLRKSGLDPTGTYWWHVDFNTDEISLINYRVIDAIWQDDQVSYLAVIALAESGGQVLKQFGAGGSNKDIGTLSGISKLVWASTDQLIATQTTRPGKVRLQSFDLPDLQSVQIADNVEGDAAVSPDASKLLFLVNNSSLDEASEGPAAQGKLTYFNLSDFRPEIIQDYFTGNAVWAPNGESWAAVSQAENPDKSWISLGEGKIKRLKLVLVEDTPKFIKVVAMTRDKLIFVDPQNRAYFAASSKLEGRQLPDVSPLQKAKYASDFYIVYNASKSQYSVYVLENSYEEGKQKALDYIKSFSVDPYQLNLKFYSTAGANP